MISNSFSAAICCSDPTALIELNGFCLLTDPTFDLPGEYQLPSIPAWVFGLAPDMKYGSGKGNTHDDAVAVWATKEPAVLAAFRNFIQNFGTHFSGISADFVEINVSLGPTGELRYPSYIITATNGIFPTTRVEFFNSTVSALATILGSGRPITLAA